MEVITMESKAFKEITSKIDKINDYICKNEDKDKPDIKSEEIILESDDVCFLLDICSRTLFRLRKNLSLPYKYEGKKCVYKLSDVEKLIRKKLVTTKIKSTEELYKKYTSYINSNSNE